MCPACEEHLRRKAIKGEIFFFIFNLDLFYTGAFKALLYALMTYGLGGGRIVP